MIEKTTLAPGTKVICEYRIPRAHQPWIGKFHIGTIEIPDPREPESGIWSEAKLCDFSHKSKVIYPFGVQLDYTENLIALTQEQAELSHKELVRLFLGEDAAALLGEEWDQERCGWCKEWTQVKKLHCIGFNPAPDEIVKVCDSCLEKKRHPQE